MLEIVENSGSPALLKVIGVGGGGSNAVNRMIQAGLRDVEFWVSNTDLQALERASAHNQLPIGKETTRGLGAGGDPEIGRLSAEEDIEAIQKVIQGADMIFITAGMGGGTGTGAAPVVARVAREMGVLTVGIVTKPFGFEGKKKMGRAARGLEALGENVDTLIAIPNQKLMHIVEPGTSFDDALLMADEVLFQATRGISDLIMGHGIINLDFADVRTVMRDRGNALLGSGAASGPDRAVEAAQAAISSPLLEEVSIEGAQALLINIQGGASMGFHEAAEAAQVITDRVGEEADVFWGAVVDPALDDELRVTLVATGFPQATRTEEVTVARSRVVEPPSGQPVQSSANHSYVPPSQPAPGQAPVRRDPPQRTRVPMTPATNIQEPGVAQQGAGSNGAPERPRQAASAYETGDDPAQPRYIHERPDRPAPASRLEGSVGEPRPLRRVDPAGPSDSTRGRSGHPADASAGESVLRPAGEGREIERDLFLPEESPSAAERSGVREPQDARDSKWGDPMRGFDAGARSGRRMEAGKGAGGDAWDGTPEEEEDRPSTRSSLDVPTFMRKRMD